MTRQCMESPNEGKRPPIKIFNCTNSGTRHGARECPTNGKTCHNCQRKHHFESMCRSRKKIHGLEQQQQEYDSDLTLFVGAVTTEIQIKNDECYVMLSVQGLATKLKVDTGSQVNIMPFKLEKIVGSSPRINACTHKLVSYSEDKLKVIGMTKLPVKYKSRDTKCIEQELTFHVVETNQPGVLGLRSSQDLGLIKVVMTAKTEKKNKLNRTGVRRLQNHHKN